MTYTYMPILLWIRRCRNTVLTPLSMFTVMTVLVAFSQGTSAQDTQLRKVGEHSSLQKVALFDLRDQFQQAEAEKSLLEGRQFETEQEQLQLEKQQKLLEQEQLTSEGYQRVAEAQQRYAERKGWMKDAEWRYSQAQQFRAEAEKFRAQANQIRHQAEEKLFEARLLGENVRLAEAWRLHAQNCLDVVDVASWEKMRCYAEAKQHEAEVYRYSAEQKLKNSLSATSSKEVDQLQRAVSRWDSEAKKWQAEARNQQIIAVIAFSVPFSIGGIVVITLGGLIFLTFRNQSGIGDLPSFLNRFLARVLREDIFADLLTLCEELCESDAPRWLVTLRFVLVVSGMLYASWRIALSEWLESDQQAITPGSAPSAGDLPEKDEERRG